MTRRGILLFVVCAFLAPAFAHAQNAGGGGGRGNFDPAQMRERMMNGIKEQLGATDEEWKVLSPKVEKVMDAQRASRGGFGGFGGGRRPGGNGGGGAGGGADATPQTPTAKASSDLRTTLENKEAPADDIKAKLTALREAREKAKAELQGAQKDLKEVLTARQEAVMVNMGMLE